MDETMAGLALLAGDLRWQLKVAQERIAALEAELANKE